MAEIHTILCVGTPPDLRRSRELVLQSAGYETSSMDPGEATNALLTTTFDVVVISVTVSEHERNLVRQTVPEQTRIVQLSHFTAPQELLTLIQLQTAD
jgi:CheY-like chemotaxis protein